MIKKILNEFPTLSFYNKIQIFLIIIICFKMEFREEGKFFNPLNFQQTKNMKGILSILVFLTHLDGLKLKKTSYYFFSRLTYGYILVGFFFFYSGYGLMKQYLTKKNYLKGFLRKRLITILIPFYLVNTICGLIFYYTGRKYYNSSNHLRLREKNPTIIFETFSGIIPAYYIGWYTIVLTILTILFYFSFKFIKYDFINIGIIFIFISYTLYYGSYTRVGLYYFRTLLWNQSTFSFFFGLIIAKFEKNIFAVVQKYHSLFLGIFLYIYFIFYDYLNKYQIYLEKYNINIDRNQYHYLKKCILFNFNCIINIIVVHIILMKVYLNNKILDFLGNISSDIYYYHKFGITLFRTDLIYFNDDGTYVFMSFIWAILIPLLMSYVNSFLVHFFLNIAFFNFNFFQEKNKQIKKIN